MQFLSWNLISISTVLEVQNIMLIDEKPNKSCFYEMTVQMVLLFAHF